MSPAQRCTLVRILFGVSLLGATVPANSPIMQLTLPEPNSSRPVTEDTTFLQIHAIECAETLQSLPAGTPGRDGQVPADWGRWH
jgi:hypothetical protein